MYIYPKSLSCEVRLIYHLDKQQMQSHMYISGLNICTHTSQK